MTDPNSDLRQFNDFASGGRGFEGVFNANYPLAYSAFAVGLQRAASLHEGNARVLDIGCGDGWTAALLSRVLSGTYLGIDPSAASLGRLRSRADIDERLSVACVEATSDWLFSDGAVATIRSELGGAPTLAICNAAIHQIRKHAANVGEFLAAFAGTVELGGLVLVGDYYYPSALESEEIERTRAWIKARTGQNPTAAHELMAPAQIENDLTRAGIETMETWNTVSNEETVLHYHLLLGSRAGKVHSDGS